MIRKKKFKFAIGLYTTQNFVWSEVFILFLYYRLFCSQKKFHSSFISLLKELKFLKSLTTVNTRDVSTSFDTKHSSLLMGLTNPLLNRMHSRIQLSIETF